MIKDNLFRRAIDGDLPTPECSRLLGVVVKKVDVIQMTVEIEFEGKKEFTNPIGNIQGGFIAAMLDDTMGPALAAGLETDEFAPTLSLSVQFHSPAKQGKLTGIGRVSKKGNQICHANGELYQNGQLIASATATSIIKKRVNIPGHAS